ncbi:arrestin domain-containing protein 17-like [Penaeus monodon]|uniref:arrestin domain-containing protein 17-like n=1 Tax=Penaeus monodon TaxID=6687 RepID=UPI0018A789CB|nr:arrestin domain-containing protein 17-like [Penaeus monodon]
MLRPVRFEIVFDAPGAVYFSSQTITGHVRLEVRSRSRSKTPMLRPVRFEIVFDAPGAVYFSSQTITGHVRLEVEEPITLKGVKMRFRGECCIHFTDTPRQMLFSYESKRVFNCRCVRLRSLVPWRLEQRCIRPCSSHIPLTPTLPPNRYAGGVDNPGYIPDMEVSKEEASDPPTRRASHRPRSSEHAWKEASLDGPKQHYRAQETYFDTEFYIYGHKYQKDEKETLPAGVHEFPFAFSLPPNLPPSFHADKGFICYVAVATLDRPAAANIVYKAGFSLHSILDLNMDSLAASNVSSSKAKNLCCFCCQTGPITLAARIPRRGYVPGEKILVSAEADNVSARNTRRTRLLLLQVITYIMPNGVKEFVEERVLKEIVRGIIPPGESDLWEEVAITVPPLVPANVHLTCRLLHVDYRIDMILEPPLPSGDLRVSLPILIGSVPLRNCFSNFLPPNETREPCGLPGINYPNFPPYWYGEYVYDRVSLESMYERITGIQDDFGPQYEPVTMFAPTYLCYTPGNKLGNKPASS